MFTKARQRAHNAAMAIFSPGGHYRRAVHLAQRAAAMLAALDVHVLITGSLARGHFSSASDIDFLVMRCPRESKYAIEAKIEDILGDIGFDVIYLDELPAAKLARFTDGAVPAVALG